MRNNCLVVLLVMSVCGTAIAQDYVLDHHASPVESAVLQLLASEGNAPAEGEPVKCGLPAVFHAQEIRRHGSGALLQAAARILDRPAMQTSVRRGAFRVHFDTAGVHAAALLDGSGTPIAGSSYAYVDSIFSSLSFVLPYETETLGYGSLPGDGALGGGPEYDVFVQELGSMYGYTTPDGWPAAGGTATTFMTIDNDFAFVRPLKNRGLPGLRVTLAHELHHALQIGNYGYWSDYPFFYEITSTWLEDVLYTDVDDYLNYLGSYGGHFRMPDKSFSSSDVIMYSRCLWGHYVSHKYGRDLMRSCWEQIRGVPPMQAIDNAFRLRGLDLGTSFAEWTLWNLFTGPRSIPGKYYPEGANYPSMVQIPLDYVPPSRDASGSLAALGTRYYQVIRPPDTMTVILSNLDLSGAGMTSPPSKTYVYHFRSSPADGSYKPTPLGIYASLGVADIGGWTSWYVVGDTIRRNYDPDALIEGRAFPNPFIPGTHIRTCIPVDAGDQVQGTLSVYTPGMELAYASANALSTLYMDRQMFFWDGKGADGRIVPSGVYVYVLDLAGRRVRGKIAVVRR